MFVITGFGLTVTVNVVSSPSHPLAEGVMTYQTVPGVLMLLVSVWLMAAPNPDAGYPVIFGVLVTVQE